jgi:2-(1,2-epoxy-1,2-dihydrophenyl)acetyl-CoA isomerase
MTAPPVLFDVSDGVAVITLNRPQVLNALDKNLMLALAQAIKDAAAPQIRAVLITGAGRAFSSGADLTTVPTSAAGLAASSANLGASLTNHYNPLILAIRQLRKPVISAVNGPAAGAGMSIALAADIILAARSATFLQAFAKLGLVPDAGSTWFLPRLIGETNTRAMTLLGAPVTAEQALRMGLVWEVYDDEQLMPAALGMATRLATQATEGLALIKDALSASPNNELATQMNLEAALQEQAGQTQDFFEGVRAFIEKRPAHFKGQ